MQNKFEINDHFVKIDDNATVLKYADGYRGYVEISIPGEDPKHTESSISIEQCRGFIGMPYDYPYGDVMYYKVGLTLHSKSTSESHINVTRVSKEQLASLRNVIDYILNNEFQKPDTV